MLKINPDIIRAISVFPAVSAIIAYSISLNRQEGMNTTNRMAFNLGVTFGALSTLGNDLARTFDHLGEGDTFIERLKDGKWLNLFGGSLNIAILLTTSILGTLSAFQPNTFQMPPGLGPVFNSATLFMGVFMNWKKQNSHCETFKMNLARMLCLVAAPAAAVFGTLSVINESTQDYFLGNALFDLGIAGGIINRVLDIFKHDSDTNFLNKCTITIFTLIMFSEMIVNFLVSLKVLSLGIAFPGIMNQIATLFYLVAQMRNFTFFCNTSAEGSNPNEQAPLCINTADNVNAIFFSASQTPMKREEGTLSSQYEIKNASA